MDNRFRMVRYRRSDRERVFDLIRAVYPNVASVLIRDWNWRYDNNPFNREGAGYRRAHHDELLTYLRTTQSAERLDRFARQWGLSKREDLAAERDDEPYILLIKTDRDEVVGMLGSIPQLFVINGQEHWTSAECDQATHPAYRNRGLSRILANRIRTDHSVSFSWYTEETQKRVTKRFRARARIAGTSQSRDAAAVRMVPWVKPLDWGVMATRLTGSRALGGAAALLSAPTRLLGWAVNRPIVVPDVRVLRIASFDEGTDQLCRRASRDYPVMAVRDQRYLNWRFVSRPDASYVRIAAIRNSSTLGYLVFRVAESDGVTCGFLVDYLVEGCSATIFSLLLQHAEECLLGEQVKAIVCSVTSSPYRNVLIRHGFVPAAFRKRCYLAAAAYSTDPRLQVFVDLRRWFVTMGDGNLEMRS